MISLFEDTRSAAAAEREDVLASLNNKTGSGRAVFIGITGTPGAGKSSLIGEIGARLLNASGSSFSAAILAVDPSSQISGGSILGDRTRVRFPVDERRLFFRSQASDLELGGVGRNTFSVCRLLYYLFDFVFVETVGIGQSELEIQHVADRIYLVLQPMGGDQIQFMKAGIMEIPDAVILNKCDEHRAAQKSYHSLRSSLTFARPSDGESIPIFKTSAHTGEGLEDLMENIYSTSGNRKSMSEKEKYFFEKWVRDEYGRTGLRLLKENTELDLLSRTDSFDRAQKQFSEFFLEKIGRADCGI